jgi:glutathione S-transferase
MTAPLKLYGYAASINVRKVLWMAEELGLAVEREDWGGGTRSPSEPAFRALNPAGMVPVIDDDGTVVWESNTIVRYLAASRGRVDLLPQAPAARARVEQWMDWQASDFNNGWRYVFQALIRESPDHRDPAAIARSQQQVVQLLGVVEGQLATSGGHITGPSFTAADIVIGLSVLRCTRLPFEQPRWPALEGYLQRLSSRPGFLRHGRDGGP